MTKGDERNTSEMDDEPELGPGTTPLWLDCDPGHDDAFAILLAAHHPSLRFLGISTVHGNAQLTKITQNALSILTAIGKQDIPVHPGAAKPFCREVSYAPDIHGTSGLDMLGNIALPKPKSNAIEKPGAVIAMRDALFAEPEKKAWLVATGALTNVALLFATFPEVVAHIKGLSIMGGALGDGFSDAPLGHVKGEGQRFGNTSPFAEFNIYCDPEAAQSIFSNAELAAKTTLIPLDLTHQVLATEEIQKMVQGPDGLTSRRMSSDLHSMLRPLFHDLLCYFAHTYDTAFGLSDGPPLHDPVAVALLLENGTSDEVAFDDRGGERWNISVVTDGTHSKHADECGQLGRTIAVASAPGKGGVRIPRGMDAKRFWEIIDSCLSTAEEAVRPS